ncbi:Transcriptional regulator [Rubrobacter radiotolerans]|uniref:LysR substrate-binding domain-containing protein n=1 Tax=Rubrobacter radiotolerans TaxID=42256 RepID=A0A023X3R3_RUBRA|nr:LysR family transcriptional regulator [Rubrobacter radiotolerans]AHY46998.1 Transcriptional regulator [Rubrobacter radiotolerans]MDX5894404.1 LysR substrate-binding domain-containing protein [Rubrobacter radiotolerans]SMC05929.1 DNA-binding transcriptional regulator, LysR family [Rubrobacter radiotolerans DSM 5868]
MNLQRLRYFVAVAEELSFTRAAEQLHMAQPPLSYQIRQLEEELGAQLFYRNKRNVRLTDAGRLLLEEARGLLVHAEQTASVVHRVGQGEVGRLSVGFVPSAANRLLPPLLRAFGERFPSVELLLREVDPDRLLGSLGDGRVDVGFLYLPLFEEASLGSRAVSREPFVAALPDTHPLADEPRLTLGALAGEPFVLTPRYRGAGLRDKIVAHCRRAGFEPRVVQEAWLMQTTVSLVAGGIGVTLVPASLQNLQRTGVVYKSIEGLSPEVELGAVWRRDDPSAVLRAFLGVVGDVTRWGEDKERAATVRGAGSGA